MEQKDKILEKLKEVKDPELGLDIVTLGLIRGIVEDDVKEKGVTGVEVTMTLTTPFCPYANEIISGVEDALRDLKYENPRVELSFEPPWEPSEELRATLGV